MDDAASENAAPEPPAPVDPPGIGCGLTLAFVFALFAIADGILRLGGLWGFANRTLDGGSPLWVRGFFAALGLGLAASFVGGVLVLVCLYRKAPRPEPYLLVGLVGAWLTVVVLALVVGAAAAVTPGGFAGVNRAAPETLFGLAWPILIALLGTAAWLRLRRARVEDPEPDGEPPAA